MDRKMHIDPARHYIPFKSAQLYHPLSVHVSLGNRAGNEKRVTGIEWRFLKSHIGISWSLSKKDFIKWNDDNDS